MVVAQTTAIEGWASQTGFRFATTAVQKTIVASANAAASIPNTSSGPSRDVLPGGGLPPWETDLQPAADSGTAIRTAIRRYDSWYVGGKTGSLATVRSAMIADLTHSRYDAVRQAELADRIISVYNAEASTGRVVVPTTDQAILDFLKIRKMCLEWAVTIAVNAHGRAKGYAPANYRNMDPSLFRPGMGLFKADRSHAMIIVDIYWSKSGQPLNFRVAEANYGRGWQNPGGMIPWERTVQNTRKDVQRGSDNVIDFETPW